MAMVPNNNTVGHNQENIYVTSNEMIKMHLSL